MSARREADPQAPFLDPDHELAVKRLETVRGLSAEELDELPFGAIQIDREGTIHAYNAKEGELAGRSPASVIGRNFFTEVAPCTNVREFAGRFRKDLGADSPYVAFPFLFEFPGRPTRVMILLSWDEGTQRGWILVEETGTQRTPTA